MEDVRELLSQQNAPDILVLTETKMGAATMREAYEGLRELGYRQQHKALRRIQPAQAGVSILVHNSLVDAGLVTTSPMPSELQGLVTAVEIRLPSSEALQVVGVYMPIGQPGDGYTRKTIYKQLSQMVDASRDADTSCNLIIAGDFNAASTKGDRQAEARWPTTCDRQLSTWIKQQHVHTVQEAGSAEGRQATFRPRGGADHPHSRIDDILVASPRLAHTSRVTVVDTTGMQTDHNMVRADVPYTALNMIPPPPADWQTGASCPPPIAEKRLKLPLSQGDKTAIATAIEQEVGPEAYQLQQELEMVLGQQVRPYWQHRAEHHNRGHHPHLTLAARHPEEDRENATRQRIDEWAARLVDMCMAARSTALAVGPTHTVVPGGHHQLPRGMSRRRQKLVSQRKQLAEAIRAGGHGNERVEGLQQRLQTAITPASTRTEDQEVTQYRRLYKQIGREIAAIDAEHVSKRRQRKQATLEHLLDTRLKVGSKLLNGQYRRRNTVALRAVQTAAGLEADPHKVEQAVHAYYTAKMQPATGVKHGKYLPHEVQRSYPWMEAGGIDKYPLCTAGVQQRTQGATLQERIADEAAFGACVKTLAGAKAPGPDGITNEILQLMPGPAHEAMHALMQIMWATAYTPAAWKESLTVLIYKNKGSPLQLQQYRRIGLENTLYKLWTRLVTISMADYAERCNILSSTQAGFRGRRSTADQLETLTLLLEDATNQARHLPDYGGLLRGI
jgi:exonuclease III